MQFDPNNIVIKLCSEGMEAEGKGEIEKAKQLYQQAWDNSTNHFEQFTAAHYLARNQEDANIELHWNLIALQHADAIKEETMNANYPSLHLNLGKAYERLKDIHSAGKHYELAESFIQYLQEDGYGKMIRSGIENALRRIQ
jgi:rifampin ADP-ribosylating transferase